MKIDYKKILLMTFMVFFSVFSFASASNLSDAFSSDKNLKSSADKMGYEVVGQPSPEMVVSIVIQTVLGLLGVIFMILLVYGGILWMTAGGNDQQIEKAKKIITNSIIGLVVVLLAYSISILVLSIFVN
jgi:hypothetical protein